MASASEGTERLRGHHLLCALGFRGHGYSPGFAANMAAILQRLRAAPETLVMLTDEPDAICAAFPPDQPAHCRDDNVIARDRRVLAKLGLEPGAIAPWGQLQLRLGHAFVPSDLDALCATCPWLPLGYCRQGLRRHVQRVGELGHGGADDRDTADRRAEPRSGSPGGDTGG